jgi:Methylase involved in ubiquinone/menaquinone biosynthesis
MESLKTKNNRIKEMVKQRYSDLALNSDELKCNSCCGTTSSEPSKLDNSCCSAVPASPSKKVFTIMSEDYSKLKGYEQNADLGLGCGLPTQYAGIRKGDTVVDLGSGAGNDCFIAREEVGETGKIIGIDFSHAMIEKARKNAAKRGFKNIEFIEGDIEDLPLPDSSANVVVSNCVLNLLPQKTKIFKEIYRVLKPEAHFCVSDVVLNGIFPKEFTNNAAMYAGCIAGAIQLEDYLEEIRKAGFEDIEVKSTKKISIPEEVLTEHLDEATIKKYKTENVGILSITLTGMKK